MGTLDLTEALVVHASQGAIEDGDWNVILDIISLKLEMVHSTFKVSYLRPQQLLFLQALG
jgi:hypothetical protein